MDFAAMDWTASIDAYCERTSAAFWAEPLNAWSNMAFFAAAMIGLSLWSLRGGKDRAGLGLCLLVAVIGAGSFLFHTVATRWASLADVLPIAVFIYAYFALALVRFFGLSRLVAALGTAAFLAGSFFAGPVFAPVVRLLRRICAGAVRPVGDRRPARRCRDLPSA